VTTNNILGVRDLARREPDDDAGGEVRLDPKLRLTIGMRHMHVHARFLTREEKESERAFT